VVRGTPAGPSLSRDAARQRAEKSARADEDIHETQLQ
jgi:hypothetical protein